MFNEPALGSNHTTAQIFVGHNSKYIDAYGVATDHGLSCTLEENIMNQGAMDVLISNNSEFLQTKYLLWIFVMTGY